MNMTLPALFHEARITLEVTKVSCRLVFFDSHQLIKVRELLSVTKTIDLICSR